MEAYPMPMFIKLSVRNIATSLNWYKEVLGFDSVFELPGNSGEIVMAHIRREKYQDIMLVLIETNKELKSEGVILNFSATDIDLIAKKAKASGGEVIEGPIDRIWNAREIVLKDVDGYLLTFSKSINQEKRFDEIIDQLKSN